MQLLDSHHRKLLLVGSSISHSFIAAFFHHSPLLLEPYRGFASICRALGNNIL